MIRRLHGLLWAALVLLLAGCGGLATASPGSGKAPLKLSLAMGLSPAPPLPIAVMWLAKDLGFYEREGLDLDLRELPAQSTIMAAMNAGEIDVGNIGPEDVLKLTATKAMDLRAINSPDARDHMMIVSRSSIGSVAELAGKSFGVSRPGGYDYNRATGVMRAKGVPVNTVNFVSVGVPTARVQALLSGRIDAISTTTGTWATIKDQPGLKILVPEAEFYDALPYVSKVNAVTAKVASEKPEQLHRFSSAIIKASRLFATDQQAWVDAMIKRRPDLDRTEMDFLWTQFKSAWAVNGSLNLPEYEATAAAAYATSDFDGVPRLSTAAWIDTRFVDAALKDAGVYPNLDNPGRPIT